MTETGRAKPRLAPRLDWRYKESRSNFQGCGVIDTKIWEIIQMLNALAERAHLAKAKGSKLRGHVSSLTRKISSLKLPHMEKLEDIPLRLDLGEIKKKLHLNRTGGWDLGEALLETARAAIRPRAVYKVCYVEERVEDSVIIDGICFRSRVLRKNLEEVGRVFAYVVTIGKELEETASSCEDLLEKYFFDSIGNVALVKARKYLEDQLRSRFALDGVSFMSPGSLGDWPIEEQRPLFSLFEGGEAAIGVRLSESLLMIPRKSVSGIYFPTEITFYSCQLCPRGRCEGRKASFDKKLVREYGIGVTEGLSMDVPYV